MSTRRIVVIGPESSGKTTLAAAVAAALDAPWTPEAARLYAQQGEVRLSERTVEPIARMAMEMEDTMLATAPPVLVRDTDLVSTIVYSRHYYRTVAPWIVTEARARLAELYLLCRPDLPWIPDGVRDRPLGRAGMFDDFSDVLNSLQATVRIVAGQGPARTEMALAAIREVMGIRAGAI